MKRGALILAAAGLALATCQQPAIAGEAAVEILPTTGTWTGMTHAGDHARVQAFMAEQVAAGRYPPSLF